MKNKILKMMLGGATIAIIFMFRYIPSASRAIKKLDFDDEKQKKKRPLQINGYNKCQWQPYGFNLQWKKIGKVFNLYIYPVKSSDQPVIPSSDLYDFFDYGMCEKYKETYLYDGMFIVYNKTKNKFEDARTYYLLENMAVNKTNQTGNAEVTLRSKDSEDDTINLNIHHNRYSTMNSTNSFLKQIWSRDIGKFYGSNELVNTWVKELINKADEDIIFTQMIPSDFHSTHWIKDNWDRFVEGYEDYEEDDTGKLITLPRFVLMTVETCIKLSENEAQIAPNVVIDTDELNPFEEKNWNWIKIGEDVVLRKVKPVPSDLHEEIQHRGIYCGLWNGGRVSNNDDVFIDISNDEKPFKLRRI